MGADRLVTGLVCIRTHNVYIDGLVQDCSSSSVLAMELLQSLSLIITMTSLSHRYFNTHISLQVYCMHWNGHYSTQKLVLSKCRFGILQDMMMSSNGNFFRVTGPLCIEFTGLRWIPRTVTRSFDVFIYLHLIKRLSKHSRGWWF